MWGLKNLPENRWVLCGIPAYQILTHALLFQTVRIHRKLLKLKQREWLTA